MAIQLSTTLRDNQAGQIESTIGTAPKLQIRTGSPPANCAAADTGTLLVEIDLPSDWLGAASGGAVAKSGTWSGTVSTAGTAGHFRIKNAAGSTTHMQGTVSATGGGGDLVLSQATAGVVDGQTVTVNTFTYTMGGA